MPIEGVERDRAFVARTAFEDVRNYVKKKRKARHRLRQYRRVAQFQLWFSQARQVQELFEHTRRSC